MRSRENRKSCGFCIFLDDRLNAGRGKPQWRVRRPLEANKKRVVVIGAAREVFFYPIERPLGKIDDPRITSFSDNAQFKFRFIFCARKLFSVKRRELRDPKAS